MRLGTASRKRGVLGVRTGVFGIDNAFLRHLGKRPTLRTLSLHAIWSFVGPVDISQISSFYGKTQGHGRDRDR